MKEVSPWITRFAPLLGEGSYVLDLACGSGRNGRYFLSKGCLVRFVDLDVSALYDLKGHRQAEVQQLDLEDGRDWPFEKEEFEAIVVTNYLHRPHLEQMLKSLKRGGVLLYETFGQGNEQFGRPRNPDFLLKPGELLNLAIGCLQVVAYEHGIEGQKVVQRICAYRASEPLPLRP